MGRSRDTGYLRNLLTYDANGNITTTGTLSGPAGVVYATQSYVGTQLAALVASAPATLDTLNELAAALGSDPNFATTVTNSIATKLPLAGGTLTGGLSGTSATFSSSVTIEGSGSSIRNANELRFYRADNAIYTKLFDSGSLAANGFVLDNMNAEGFHFKNNGVTIMRMPSNNYVGIGTTAPTERLHIAGPSNNVFLNEATSGNYAINRLKNSTFTVDFGLDASGMYLDGSTGSFRYFNGASQRMVIGSDGAMGFNYPVLGSRSFMFRGLAGRVLVIEAAEAGGVHSIYLRPNASGRHLISSNYLSGGVYLPLALSARENDTDFVLATNGRVGIGTSSPSGIVSIAFDQSSNNQFLNFVGTQASFNQEYGFGIVNSTKDFRFYDYSAGKERFRITNAGDITYGVTAAYDTSIYWRQDFTGNIYARLWADGNPRFNIQVFGSGGVYLAAGGTSWTAASDERLKTDLLPIENATNKVIQLRTMIGRYKTDNGTKRRSFLIAQDVQAVLPEAVDVDQKTGLLGVQYTEVIPLLVASIKELKAELDLLKNK